MNQMIMASAFTNFGNFLSNFVKSDIMPLGVTLGGVSIIAAGFAFLGTRPMKDWAKSHLLYIAAGVVIIYFGLEMVQTFVQSFGF